MGGRFVHFCWQGRMKALKRVFSLNVAFLQFLDNIDLLVKNKL